MAKRKREGEKREVSNIEKGRERDGGRCGPEKGSSIRATRTAIKGSFHQYVGGIILCVARTIYTAGAHKIPSTMCAVCFGGKGVQGMSKHTRTKRTKRASYYINGRAWLLHLSCFVSVCLFSAADAPGRYICGITVGIPFSGELETKEAKLDSLRN